MVNKKSSIIFGTLVAAVVIAAFVLGFVLNKPSKSVGGERGGLQSFSDGIAPGDQIEIWKSKTMPALDNEVEIWKNDTGKDAYVSLGDMVVPTGSTASSSVNVSVFATTSSSIGTWADFGTLAEGKRSIITAVLVATSTTASTTSSVYAAANGKGNGEILVPNGSRVFGFLQQVTSLASIACAKSGACETATSSARGYNPKFNLKIHYDK